MAKEESAKAANRDKLITEYQGYARALATKLMKSMSLPSDQLDEFVAAGYLGLVEAAERFDYAAGVEFKNFAYLRIRGAIIDAMREASATSERGYRFARAYQAVQELQEDSFENSKSALPAKPVTADLKLGSEFTLAQILEYAAQGALVFRLSFDDVDEEVFSDEEQGNLEDRIIKQEQTLLLKEALETLPDKERLVIREFYFNDKSFVEIANEHERLSKSWVSRLHARALRLLNEAYSAKNPAVGHHGGMADDSGRS